MKRNVAIRLLQLLLALAGALSGALAGVVKAEEPSAKDIEFFEKQVRPLLIERCYDCHNEDLSESELRLDSLAAMLKGGSRGPAIVIGEPKKSLLISAINHDGQLQMPAKEKLPQKDIAKLIEWVRVGAPWPGAQPPATVVKPPKASGPLFSEEEKSFWAFLPVVKPQPPEVSGKAWGSSPIDAFVQARREAAGFTAAPPADKRTLIRRATFDLTGLPPSIEQVDTFLADQSSGAFARLIDSLLDSPQYGERWGRHWLDIARYADSNGLDENLAYANAHRYRDYVIAAFNNDKPYDQFVREQLAGDLMTDGVDLASRFERVTATGFLSVGAKMLAEDDQMKMQMDIIDEQIDTLGRAFMGITLGCARCHDHKFDPIRIEDYYSLAGIFKSTKTMENFKVVARWQERPLASPQRIAQRDAIQEQVNDQTAQLDQFMKTANDTLLAEARQHVADYLLAAEELRQIDALTENANSLGTPDKASPDAPAGLVIVEAENFDRGNVKKSFTGYGEGIGVIYNKGQYPNFAEYDIDLPQAAWSQLEIRYAAADSRPVKLSINGQLVKSDAAGEVTGSWYPKSQRWLVQGVFQFNAGKNTIRLERQEPFPHLDKILVVPVRDNREPSADAYHPKRQFVRQWAEALKKSAADANSPLAPWNRFVATGNLRGEKLSDHPALADLLEQPLPTSSAELAARYAQLLAKIDRQWQAFLLTPEGKDAQKLPDSRQESLRQILYDPQGPFALGDDPSALYEPTTREQVKQHREKIASLEKTLPKFPQAMAVSDSEPQNLRVHIRGSHFTLGQETPRQFPRIIAGENQTPIDDQHSGRLELARWISSADHPLTARVMVNRIWSHHFGEGLVRTPDNFGRLGQRPTHPLLLDYLAARFVQEGWSIKQMHRLIMLSSTYRMSAQYDAAHAETDPENRLLWRMNRRRLEAEAIRDAILSVCGNLDLTPGGTMLKIENRKYVTSTANVDPVTYQTNRRSVYLPIVRSALYEVLQAFDFADPSVLIGRRESTTVAPQALFMMNSQFVSQQTKSLAQRLLDDEKLNDSQRVRLLFETAYSRPPEPSEIDRSLAYLQQYTIEFSQQKTADDCRLRAWQSLCRVVIAANEFIFVE